MRLKEIRIYPIKSIRGVSLQQHEATAMGFDHDRIFMLQRVSDDKNMHVPHFPSMCLFTTELSPAENPTKVLVRFGKDHVFDQEDKKLPTDEAVLEIPLIPDVNNLEKIDVNLHGAQTSAYTMPADMCKWFSTRFGFEVRLNYIGASKRPVLGNLHPDAPRSYVGDPDPRTTINNTASPKIGRAHV